MSENQKKFSKKSNYTKRFPILLSGITGCVSISVFASVIGVFIGITSSAIELKLN